VNFIKYVFAKIGSGFLYGVGFVIASLLLGSLAFSYVDSNLEAKEQKRKERELARQEERRLMFRDFDETAKLDVEVTKERIEPGEFTLLGKVENRGDAKWSYVSVKAELFNESGDFIDECTEIVSETIAPGQVLNFKLSCGACSQFKLRDYKKYELKITDARYVR